VPPRPHPPGSGSMSALSWCWYGGLCSSLYFSYLPFCRSFDVVAGFDVAGVNLLHLFHERPLENMSHIEFIFEFNLIHILHIHSNYQAVLND